MGNQTKSDTSSRCWVWKVFKYGVISGPYFPAFGLNTEYLSVLRPNSGKYRPEITPYLETFHAVQVAVKQEFSLASSLWKFGQIPGVRKSLGSNIAKYGTWMLHGLYKKNIHQKFIPGIFQRDIVGNCWKSFIINFDSNNDKSIVLDWSYGYFLLQHVCITKILHLCVREKVNKWNCLAVNYLIEFLNYRIYTAREKRGNSSEAFCRKPVLINISDSAGLKEYKTCKKRYERVQHERWPTWKKWNTGKRQHEKSVTRKMCNMKRMQHKEKATQIVPQNALKIDPWKLILFRQRFISLIYWFIIYFKVVSRQQ